MNFIHCYLIEDMAFLSPFQEAKGKPLYTFIHSNNGFCVPFHGMNKPYGVCLKASLQLEIIGNYLGFFFLLR